MRRMYNCVRGGVMRGLTTAFVAACSVLSAFAITPNAQETELANLITTDTGQQRATMTYHPIFRVYVSRDPP